MLHLKRVAVLTFVLATLEGSPREAFSQKPADVPVSSTVAVAPQYDSTHVYVNPADVDMFVKSFLGTFGGTTTKQVSVTVTPTPSLTTSQLLQTPVGTISLFGFTTPIPAPFGTERTGYLVSDMDAAIKSARAAGADVIVTPYPDPIGLDAVIGWPGGIRTQIYWHTKKPSYAPFARVPENRVYVSTDRADAFLKSFINFSAGKVVSDVLNIQGAELGLSTGTIRRIQVVSAFGKLLIFVTNGHIPYPYGRETTGYEVVDLNAILAKASTLGVKVLVPPIHVSGRDSAMVQFPGGYIAEIHQINRSEAE